jgi:hypothetical protein
MWCSLDTSVTATVVLVSAVTSGRQSVTVVAHVVRALRLKTEVLVLLDRLGECVSFAAEVVLLW